jgi:type II secretory pathway component PulM
MKTPLKIEKTLPRRAARWVVNGIFLLAAIVFSASIFGCASGEAQRQQEIAFVESQIRLAEDELENVKAARAAGTITPEAAEARALALEGRISRLREELVQVKARPVGFSLLETILIAAATAFGLRGTPTGGIGGYVVSIIGGLFQKKKPAPQEAGPA